MNQLRSYGRRALSAALTAIVLTPGMAAASLDAMTSEATDGLLTDRYLVALNKAPIGEAADSVEQLAAALVKQYGGQVLHTYDSVAYGFNVHMNAAQAAAMALNPAVDHIDADRAVRLLGEDNNAVWGLDRIDQRELPLDQTYIYPDSGGAGVHIYIIDSGITPDHSEFAGDRQGEHRNFLAELVTGTDPDDWEDCNGHGTHVTSTAAGNQWGVARRATIHALRVFDCLGNTAGGDVLAAVEWVYDNAILPAVVNMSLGTQGGRWDWLDEAVAALYERDILTAAAAGNERMNACDSSPSGEPTAVTVAATDNDDTEASYTNFGSCVDLYAPGTDIEAADIDDLNGKIAISGTSMASPHVAGAIALLLAKDPGATGGDMTAKLLADATPNALVSVPANTPNLLLFVNPLDDPAADAKPKAKFSVACDRLECSFDGSASSDFEGLAAYNWDLGDGAQGTGATLTHSYADIGDYTVTLTVTDTAGQTDSMSQVVTVNNDPVVPPPCDGCTKYEGVLANAGDNGYAPHKEGFSFDGGTLSAVLDGAEGTDFDLYLERYTPPSFFGLRGGWTSVVRAETYKTSHEEISTTVEAGQYRWRAYALQGTGSYTLWATTP